MNEWKWPHDWRQLGKALPLFCLLTACHAASFQRAPGTSTESTVSEPEEELLTNPPTSPNKERQKLFTDCSNTQNKFLADLYALPADTKKLPDFTQMKAIRQVCLRQLDVTSRNFEEGFPTLEDFVEWFALNIRFKVNIAVAGDYQFKLISDDGAILYLEDKEFINLDGVHAAETKTNRINLKPGWHNFTLSYFQGPRTVIALELLWKEPGSSRESYLPLERVSPP